MKRKGTHKNRNNNKRAKSSTLSNRRSHDESVTSSTGLPSPSEILHAITITYMESVMPTTTTYQANLHLQLNAHMLNVLSNLNPLRQIPAVLLSLIAEYCKRVHVTPWLRLKPGETLPPFSTKRLSMRPSEQTLMQGTSFPRATFQSKLAAWRDYFQYRLYTPSSEAATFTAIVDMYLRSNYSHLPQSVTFKMGHKCLAELKSSFLTKMSWLRAHILQRKEQCEIATVKYQCTPRRTSGYLLFVIEELKKMKNATVHAIDGASSQYAVAKIWKSMDETNQKEWQTLSHERNKNEIAQLQQWIHTMDQVELESHEWISCWSNPDSSKQHINIKPQFNYDDDTYKN